ncbi:hypothetical protein ACFV1B_09095 [Streptomyces sp. NPDC059637]
MKKTLVARALALAFFALLFAGALPAGAGEARTAAIGAGSMIDWP